MPGEERPEDHVPTSYLVVVDRLARIEVKLDEALKLHQDHESRLRVIERWKYALPLTAFTAVISGALAVFAMVYGR